MTNTYLFLDPTDSTPTGWSVDANFNDTYIRGSSSWNLSAGSATQHNHDLSSLTCVNTTSHNLITSLGKDVQHTRSYTTHTHTLSSFADDNKSNDPPYRQLKVIKYTGVPSTLEADVIAIFDETVASGWTRYSSQDGKYIKGTTGGTAGTGGSLTHTHTITGTLDTDGTTNGGEEEEATGPHPDHTHSFSQNSGNPSVDCEPPYITAYLYKNDSQSSLKDGMIAMFDDDPGANWAIVSGDGDDFYQKFIKPADGYGSTGGASTHTHSLSAASSAPSATVDYYGSVPSQIPSATHTHTVTATLDAVSHLPKYADVLMYKYTAPAAGYTDSGLRVWDGSKYIVVGKSDTRGADDILCLWNGSEYVYPALVDPDDADATNVYIWNGSAYKCLVHVS